MSTPARPATSNAKASVRAHVWSRGLPKAPQGPLWEPRPWHCWGAGPARAVTYLLGAKSSDLNVNVNVNDVNVNVQVNVSKGKGKGSSKGEGKDSNSDSSGCEGMPPLVHSSSEGEFVNQVGNEVECESTDSDEVRNEVEAILERVPWQDRVVDLVPLDTRFHQKVKEKVKAEIKAVWCNGMETQGARCVVLDETPRWLKQRGEESVIASLKEVHEADKRRKLRRAIKRKQEPRLAEAIEAMIEAGAGRDETRDMISLHYQAGGDKHRLTLINTSAVKHWFQPELQPEFQFGLMTRI